MFVPQKVDFTIYQGSSLRLAWEIVQKGTASPVDLTGYKARMQMRERLKDEGTVLDLTTENGGISIAVSPEKTLLTIYASPATTAGISVKKGVYDLELVDASGEVFRLMEGGVTVSPEVTR